MDEPVRYVPDSGKVPGIYYVETESYLPLRGNGWYSQPMVEYCLEHEYIKEADIKYVVKAGIRIKKDYFNNFIDYVYENFDEKMAKFAINTTIGCFKPKEKTNWKTLAITTNSNESFNLLMQHNGCFIEDRRIRDQHYYHTYTSYTTRNEETESPIYNMIIDMEAIEFRQQQGIQPSFSLIQQYFVHFHGEFKNNNLQLYRLRERMYQILMRIFRCQVYAQLQKIRCQSVARERLHYYL
jgi:hypothetical protein